VGLPGRYISLLKERDVGYALVPIDISPLRSDIACAVALVLEFNEQEA
jgi:hypothetical protein